MTAQGIASTAWSWIAVSTLEKTTRLTLLSKGDPTIRLKALTDVAADEPEAASKPSSQLQQTLQNHQCHETKHAFLQFTKDDICHAVMALCKTVGSHSNASVTRASASRPKRRGRCISKRHNLVLISSGRQHCSGTGFNDCSRLHHRWLASGLN